MMEQTPEEELYGKLAALNGTIPLYKGQVMSAIEYYAWQILRKEDHKLINKLSVWEARGELMKQCPHYSNCLAADGL